MNKSVVLLAAMLSACASTNYDGISTTSPIYNAKYAAQAGLNQQQTTYCNTKAQEVFWAESTGVDGGFRNVAAGKEFEACVDRKRTAAK